MDYLAHCRMSGSYYSTSTGDWESFLSACCCVHSIHLIFFFYSLTYPSLSLFLATFLSNSCQYISLDQPSLVPFCQCHWWWSGIPQGCNIQHWTGYWPRPFDSWQTSWVGNEKNPDKHSYIKNNVFFTKQISSLKIWLMWRCMI